MRNSTIAKEKQQRINDQIRNDPLRVIDSEGGQVGIISLKEAIEAAEDAGLDLVEISPNADPPVCKIMDYGKFLYNESKQKHEDKKKQKQITVKEIKFRPGTDIGDYDIKLRKLRDFLEKGNKAKVTMRFRGREMAHKELGLEMLKKVELDLSEIASVEQSATMEGRQMVMVMGPRRN